MKQREIEIILMKLINDQLSAEENDILLAWLKEPENEQYFQQFMVSHNLILQSRSTEFKRSSEYLKQRIKQDRVRRFYSYLKYAAVVALLLGIAQYLITPEPLTVIEENGLTIVQQDVVLKLDNGKEQRLDNEATEDEIRVAQNEVATKSGNSLSYKDASDQTSTSFNELSVPFGKKFQVELSDGTRVFLNAGSVLRYPVRFAAGQERQVSLLNGEAYFEVTKDSERPFIVNSKHVMINVLGTTFNVTDYSDDSISATVLVEGAVNLASNSNEVNNTPTIALVPGDRATWDRSNMTMELEQVDTRIYTSWISGKLVFKNTQFNDIIKRLERNYNVTIVNNNKELGEQYYNATFHNETITQVLMSFSKTFNMKYTIRDNKVIIN